MRDPQAGVLQRPQVLLALLPRNRVQPGVVVHLAHQVVKLGIGRFTQQAVLGEIQRSTLVNLFQGGLQVQGAQQLQHFTPHSPFPDVCHVATLTSGGEVRQLTKMPVALLLFTHASIQTRAKQWPAQAMGSSRG
ncbi:hypothetical protein D3C72_1863070 [compost metagenome]